jgi:hypothetical protein
VANSSPDNMKDVICMMVLTNETFVNMWLFLSIIIDIYEASYGSLNVILEIKKENEFYP